MRPLQTACIQLTATALSPLAPVLTSKPATVQPSPLLTRTWSGGLRRTALPINPSPRTWLSSKAVLLRPPDHVLEVRAGLCWLACTDWRKVAEGCCHQLYAGCLLWPHENPADAEHYQFALACDVQEPSGWSKCCGCHDKVTVAAQWTAAVFRSGRQASTCACF